MKRNSETIEELYERKFNWMPDSIRKEIRHFNVFKLEAEQDKKTSAQSFLSQCFSVPFYF